MKMCYNDEKLEEQMMTIPISLEVKESAYDKIIYFLSHLKDDVIIVNRENLKAKNGSKLNQIKVLERLSKLDRLMAQSNNKVVVTRKIATNTDGMIDDISYEENSKNILILR